MKYSVKKLTEDFIFEEIERVRIQFVDGLSYTLESAKIAFDEKATDPLDIYIEYDFQQKEQEDAVYGFNLAEEIGNNFGLTGEMSHSSEQLLGIGKSLRELADEIDKRYDPEPSKTLADIQDKVDKENTEFAENVNRSYRDVLKDAQAKDEALRQQRSLVGVTSSLIQKTIKDVFKNLK